MMLSLQPLHVTKFRHEWQTLGSEPWKLRQLNRSLDRPREPKVVSRGGQVRNLPPIHTVNTIQAQEIP